jgi:nucleoid DNA-binding protein
MERIMKKSEIIDEIAERTGFFKCNVKEMVEAYSDIIIEQFQTAEFGADSELHIAPGVVLVGKRKPAGEAKDPRTGEMIISPEKVIPSATFKQSIRLKLYKKPKGYKKKKKG